MIKKIKILFYAHDLCFGGSWRKVERMLDKINIDLFDPFVFYWDESPNNERLPYLQKKLDNNHLAPFQRSIEKYGPEKAYTPTYSNFIEKAKQYDFDICYFPRSGHKEWVYIDRFAKLQIENNIFAGVDNSPYLDKSICLSHYIAKKRGKCDAVVYNPIPDHDFTIINWRSKYNIPQDAIVAGRIGTPADESFHPIALQVFQKLTKEFKNIYFIIVAPGNKWTRFVHDNKINNVILVDFTVDDTVISEFYQTIDFFMHARCLGETFGSVIAESLMAGKPVVSHKVNKIGYCSNNGHGETIGKCGLLANNEQEYYDFCKEMIINTSKRIQLGKMARDSALDRFESTKVTRQLEQLFIKWLGEIKK